MKAFVASVVALAASTGASPAADPQLYTTGLLGAAVVPNVAVGVVPEVALKDSGLVHHPNGAITPENTAAQKEAGLNQGTPIQQYQLTGKAVTTTYGLHGVPLALGKREAEAEADPALVYAGVPAVVSTSGLVAHPNGAVTPDYTPAQKIAAANHLAAKGIAPIVPTIAYTGYAGIHGIHYGKRDADAEAKPYYGLYGAYGIPRAYGYGIPTVHYGKREAEAEAKPYYGLYGAYGIPSAYGYGIPTVHYGKREAEAEAKPYYGLYGAYGVPAVSTYGYPGVYHYGKRSADAEAEAKPYYGLYGAYGVPAVSTYGYPAVYHYGKRSADADPAYIYGLNTPYLGYGGYAYPYLY